MGVPNAVIVQERAAMAALEQANTADGSTGAQPADPTSNLPAAPAADAVPAPAAVLPPAATSEQTPAAVPDATLQSQLQALEQKYRVLQGKYNAEVPELQRKLRDATHDAESLRNQLAAAKAAPAHNASLDEVMAGAREKFDPELVDVMREMVSAAVTPVTTTVAEVTQRVDRAAATAETSAQQSKTARLHAAIAQAGGSFEAIDNDPAFIAWLAEPVPYTGRTRHELMQASFDAGNPEQTAQFYIDYLRQKAPTPKPSAPSLPTAPVRPSTSVAPAPNGVTEPRITGQFITDFYADVTRGAYRHRPDELKKTEARINAAIARGEVAS